MSDSDSEPTFAEFWSEQWKTHWQGQKDVWTGVFRQSAVTYRDFLDRRLSDETYEIASREWAQFVAKTLLDAMKGQRAARKRFLESQLAMLDRYIEMLDRARGDGEAEADSA